MARLYEKYKSEIVPGLKDEFKITNHLEVPRLVKICVNMGLGSYADDKGVLAAAAKDLTQIVGQKAVLTKAKISVSNFKIREGAIIGCRVTLRRARMYEFFDRLVSVAIPGLRDFQGLSPKAFDGRGNFSMGLDEQSVFPEINPDKIDKPLGMDITFVTNAGKDDKARALLKLMGMPFRN